MRARARGYVLKGSSQAEIVNAIRAVGSGEAVFGPAIVERLMLFFASTSAGPRQAFPERTDREREVLEVIARGETNAQSRLGSHLSQKTIRIHASNIFTKLRVADRAKAIVRAREAGFGRERDRIE